jgi:amino acid adenylation domain-containing protein
MKIKLLHQVLKNSSKKFPDKIAILDKDKSITYKDLDNKSDYIKNLILEKLKINKSVVGVFTEKSINSILAFLGVLKSGSSYIPIDSYYLPIDRIKKIIFMSEMKLIITDEKNYKRLVKILNEIKKELKYDIKIINIDNVDYSNELIKVNNSINIEENDLAYILYTSGSTGMPKGVMISHLNACTFVNWAVDYFKPLSNDVFSNFASFSFDLSVFDMYVSIMVGAKLSIIPNNILINPKWVLNWITKNEITIMYTVPSLWINLIDYTKLNELSFNKLEKILFAGEVFNKKYLKKLMNMYGNCRFFNLYGPTETNVCTYYEVEKSILKNDTPIPIGYLCSGLKSKVVDEKNEEVDIGDKGELLICGDIVTCGYYLENRNDIFTIFYENNKENSYYRTGDIVKKIDNKLLEYVGRKDNMIKHMGFRIELNEIERCILMHDSIKEAVVIQIDLGYRKVLSSILKVDNEENFSQISIKKFIGEILPSYMIPEYLFILENMPINNNGKIDRKKIESFVKSKFLENGDG